MYERYSWNTYHKLLAWAWLRSELIGKDTFTLKEASNSLDITAGTLRRVSWTLKHSGYISGEKGKTQQTSWTYKLTESGDDYAAYCVTLMYKLGYEELIRNAVLS